MPAKIEAYVLDNGLAVMKNNTTHMVLCSAEPTTYAIATGAAQLGSKNWGANNAWGVPADSTTPTGRQVTSVPITNGAIAADGTANWWAALDVTNGRLHAHGPLSAPQVCTVGNTWALGSVVIKVPDTA